MTITIGESNVQLLPERPTSKSNHGNNVYSAAYSTTLLRDLEVSCSTVVTAHVNKTCIHTRAHRHDTQRCSIMLDRRWCFSLGLHGRIMGGGGGEQRRATTARELATRWHTAQTTTHARPGATNVAFSTQRMCRSHHAS